MYPTLLLTFLAVTVLPSAFAEDFVQGAPTLIFQSHLSDAVNPLRASVEVDRQNNIKGTRTTIIGSVIGPNPPAATGTGKLIFPPAAVPGPVPGTGGGVVQWGPFRLDHNTVWNTNADPVEDNAWIFSWRSRFTATTVPNFGGYSADADRNRDNLPWQVLFDFPVRKQVANLAIAFRTRATTSEIAVFMGEDPSKMQSILFANAATSTPTLPVYRWSVPNFPATNPHAQSYVLYLPMADRTPSPTIELSFVASPGDFVDKASITDIRLWLGGVVNLALTNKWTVVSNTFFKNFPSAPGPLTYTIVDFEWPTTGKVGTYSATILVNSPFQNLLARAYLNEIATGLANILAFPPAAAVLNPAQNLGSTPPVYAVRFTSVVTNTRIPGGFNENAPQLWIDGTKQFPMNEVGFTLVPKNVVNAIQADQANFLNRLALSYPGPTTNIFWDANTWSFGVSVDAIAAVPVASECRAGVLDLNRLDTLSQTLRDYAQLLGGGTQFKPLSKRSFDIGYSMKTVKDIWNVGGVSTCQIDFVFRIRPVVEWAPSLVATNSDNDPLSMKRDDVGDNGTWKRQIVDPDESLRFNNGPLVFVGGHPTVWNSNGPSTFFSLIQSVELEDIKFYTTAGKTSQNAISESFLRTLVQCGDGELDFVTESCDARDPTCTTNCTCPYRTVPKAPMGCTWCGNGFLDNGESCDYSVDPWCKKDCSGCSDASMISSKGRCTYCGNGKLDVAWGEACDFASDSNCNTDCKSCKGSLKATGNAKGTCFTCGNGVLDAGEVCDSASVFHLCSSDCSSCVDGYVPDRLGGCTLCGNGVVDPNEICDSALTACLGCTACDELHVPSLVPGGGCVRCGNGGLDAGEVCDRQYTFCHDDCQSCKLGTVPSGDSLGTCTKCGNGQLDVGEKCDADENCVDCQDCRPPFHLFPGGVCLLCGNGLLDEGEMCDSVHPECMSACQGCHEGYEPKLDFKLNPTGMCVPTECGSAPTGDGLACVCK